MAEIFCFMLSLCMGYKEMEREMTKNKIKNMKMNIKSEIIVASVTLIIFVYFSGKVIGKAIYYLVN
ncbi:hypothetical protein LX74_02901 [Elizabethkingia miricola]|uniref:Uncharacterized protein n=1 Tax=Elizabethkingia miricola TaxID=172045 RepID=A0ABY3NDS8_ELIMR|nr:hypothetical protein LX74_02901 [Elizabethkingia miricola]